MGKIMKNGWLIISAGLIVAMLGVGIEVAVAAQPQMEGALQALQAAQEDLKRVTLDKGGHANNARRMVADAIAQVQAGIEYGRAHGY